MRLLWFICKWLGHNWDEGVCKRCGRWRYYTKKGVYIHGPLNCKGLYPSEERQVDSSEDFSVYFDYDYLNNGE